MNSSREGGAAILISCCGRDLFLLIFNGSWLFRGDATCSVRVLLLVGYCRERRKAEREEFKGEINSSANRVTGYDIAFGSCLNI